MSNRTFLENLLSLAMRVTQAERGLAVDLASSIFAAQTVSTEDVAVLREDVFALNNCREAIATGEAFMANNVIADISEAPTTNTNFANLRIGVAIPVRDIGAVYVDRRVSTGVINRSAIDRIVLFVAHILAHDLLDSDELALNALYDQLAVK